MMETFAALIDLEALKHVEMIQEVENLKKQENAQAGDAPTTPP